MPWYKTGTVAVTLNSNAVIGTGTAFIANSRVGDAFRGPDGGWYEVTNIASDTAMSISPPYRGATTTGSYAITPVQGYPKTLTDAFNNLYNQFGTKLAAMGTASAVDIQTSVIDPTAGRAMLNGAWGWGSVSADNPTDLNAIAVSQKFGINTGASNIPWALGSTTVPFAAGSSGIAMTWTANHQSQIIVNRTSSMVALRRKNAGVWAPDDYFCLYPTGTTCLSVEQGGTGGKTPADARAGIGLGPTASLAIGSIEITAALPFIDFHFNNTVTDYNVRLINSASGTLDALVATANDFRINGSTAWNDAIAAAKIAAIGIGGVGSYAFCFSSNAATPGATVAGWTLYYGFAIGQGSLSPPGTWRCMGDTVAGGRTLFQRIS
jgi:hypothetical protein